MKLTGRRGRLDRSGRSAGRRGGPDGRLAAAAIVATLASTPARADAPRLDWPVDCALGETCFVQDHVDLDPGPGVAEFGCGERSRDGHNGVDIRLRHLGELTQDVGVLAAADGRVARVRDGEPDRLHDGAPLDGKDCGNGALILHGGGWSTQYCHLKRGSLAVRPGDTVSAGDRIGAVGLSGATNYPHLHLTLRRDETVIDPFSGRAVGSAPRSEGVDCAATTNGAWRTPIAYEGATLLEARFTNRAPQWDEIKAGHDRTEIGLGDGPALVFWTTVLGLREGDVVEMRLRRPDGALLAEKVETAGKSQAVAFRFLGGHRPDAGWPTGVYLGSVVLSRAGATLIRAERAVSLP